MIDPQIGNPTVADWLLFAALYAGALAWYPRWAARFIQSVQHDLHEQRRAAAYWTLCVLLIVSTVPWLILGLIT